MSVLLHLGRWQDKLIDVECDSIITDPPYSDVTDAGYMSHGSHAVAQKTEIGYPPITRADACEIALSWHERVRKWVVIFGDHVSREWHREAWAAFPEWYTFNAPVVWVKKGAPPRFAGDGPASQCEFITVARRRNLGKWRSLPGWYLVSTPRGREGSGQGYTGVTGNKDLGGMQTLVDHYSKPGDKIVDLFVGSGTTLRAARAMGRDAEGAELLPKHYEIARRWIDKPDTPDLFKEAA